MDGDGTSVKATDLARVTWRRASRCDNSGGSCVEVAMLGDQVLTRDSKDLDAAPQIYTRNEWNTFVDGVKGGEFDL